jgi:biotin operon repressor
MAGPTERLLSVLSALQSRPTWTGPQLALHLGVTVRTVRRDIDRLRQLGYPIDSDTGLTGCYRLGVGGAAGAVPPPSPVAQQAPPSVTVEAPRRRGASIRRLRPDISAIG